ncbi:hypothetical protein GCM10020331_012720 [Ectobacillus funiculus]
MTRKYRLKNDSIDLRDIYYRSTQYKSVTDLPEEVDLRNKLSPIVDQGELGSCTANAIASGLGEFKLLQEGKTTDTFKQIISILARTLFRRNS